MIVVFGGGLPAWLQALLLIFSLLSQAPSWSQRTVRACDHSKPVHITAQLLSTGGTMASLGTAGTAV